MSEARIQTVTSLGNLITAGRSQSVDPKSILRQKPRRLARDTYQDGDESSFSSKSDTSILHRKHFATPAPSKTLNNACIGDKNNKPEHSCSAGSLYILNTAGWRGLTRKNRFPWLTMRVDSLTPNIERHLLELCPQPVMWSLAAGGSRGWRVEPDSQVNA